MYYYLYYKNEKYNNIVSKISLFLYFNDIYEDFWRHFDHPVNDG